MWHVTYEHINISQNQHIKVLFLFKIKCIFTECDNKVSFWTVVEIFIEISVWCILLLACMCENSCYQLINEFGWWFRNSTWYFLLKNRVGIINILIINLKTKKVRYYAAYLRRDPEIATLPVESPVGVRIPLEACAYRTQATQPRCVSAASSSVGQRGGAACSSAGWTAGVSRPTRSHCN